MKSKIIYFCISNVKLNNCQKLFSSDAIFSFLAMYIIYIISMMIKLKCSTKQLEIKILNFLIKKTYK